MIKAHMENTAIFGSAKYAPASFAAHAKASEFAKALAQAASARTFSPIPGTTTDAAGPARKKNRPPRRPQIEKYDFPNITVGRSINMPQAGSAWRSFEGRLTTRYRGWRLGRILPLSSLVCVYFTPHQMNEALRERYEAAARLPGDNNRQEIAGQVRDKIKQLVEGLSADHSNDIKRIAFQADLEKLRERALDPDNPKWLGEPLTVEEARIANTGYDPFDRQDLADQMLVTKPDRLWTPGKYRVGEHEATGEYSVGLTLADEYDTLRSERDLLIQRFCGRLGFNSRHFTNEWQPQLDLIQTVQPVHQLKALTLPGAPLFIPLKPPSAFIA